MSIYTIGDLHLSFKNPKPMTIFGENWNNHEEKIRKNWIETVREEDTVIHPGDFSWGMNLEDTIKNLNKEFRFLRKRKNKEEEKKINLLKLQINNLKKEQQNNEIYNNSNFNLNNLINKNKNYPILNYRS